MTDIHKHSFGSAMTQPIPCAPLLRAFLFLGDGDG